MPKSRAKNNSRRSRSHTANANMPFRRGGASQAENAASRTSVSDCDRNAKPFCSSLGLQPAVIVKISPLKTTVSPVGGIHRLAAARRKVDDRKPVLRERHGIGFEEAFVVRTPVASPHVCGRSASGSRPKNPLMPHILPSVPDIFAHHAHEPTQAMALFHDLPQFRTGHDACTRI